MKTAGHVIPLHWSAEETKRLAGWKPKSLKVVNPDATRLNEFYKVTPDTLYVLRDHALSEDKDAALKDPVGTGTRHADEWFSWIQDAYFEKNLLIPINQLVFLGINEPAVWADVPDDSICKNATEALVLYTVAFLDRLASCRMRGGALNMAVGHPANDGTGTPVNWSEYDPVHEAILRFPGHFVVLHEYFDHLGPQPTADGKVDMDGGPWGWKCGRYLQLPWDDVKIIIGEAGLDEYVSNETVPDHMRGWKAQLQLPGGEPNKDLYLFFLNQYEVEVRKDPRIHSWQIFTWDGDDDDWHTFYYQEIIDMLGTNTEFDNGTEITDPTLEEAAIAHARMNQCIFINPSAALQNAILADGNIITGPEFTFAHGEKEYVGQRGETPDRQPYSYYVEIPLWENVMKVPFAPEDRGMGWSGRGMGWSG